MPTPEEIAKLENINKARTMLGQPALTELPVVENKADEGKTTSITTTQDSDTPKGAETKENNTVIAKKETEKPETKTVPQAKQKLTKEQLLEALKEEGIDISSFDELSTKSKESPEEIAQKREQAKLAYAFSKLGLNPKKYQSYAADSSDLVNLVYRNYLTSQKKEEPSLTDAEIMEEFQEKYGTNADQSSRQFKAGQNAIQVLGEKILKETYPEVFSIEDEYTKFETTENTRKAEEKKLLVETPKYKAHIEDIFANDLKKVVAKIGDKEYEIEISEEALIQAKNEFLDTDYAASKVKEGFKKEAITEVAKARLIIQNLDYILTTGAKKYLFDHQAGVKGIVIEGAEKKTETSKPISEATKKARQLMNLPSEN